MRNFMPLVLQWKLLRMCSGLLILLYLKPTPFCQSNRVKWGPESSVFMSNHLRASCSALRAVKRGYSLEVSCWVLQISKPAEALQVSLAQNLLIFAPKGSLTIRLATLIVMTQRQAVLLI